MRKLFVLLFIFTSFVSNAQECNITLSGIVLDGYNQSPLEYSAIKEEKNLFGTITDKKGLFSITGLCKGTYQIHVKHLICEHLDLQISITRDTFITIRLPHTNHDLSTAFVVGNKDKLLKQNNKLKPAELLTLKGNTIGEIMQNLQGVTILSTGGTIAKPIINGMYGYRTLIINNGIRQEGQNWGQEHAPEIDPFTAKEIELLRGPIGLKYGPDAIGGIIMVNPASIFNYRQNLITGSLNSGFESNSRMGFLSAYAGGRFFDKVPLYWRLQGTIRNQGNLKTPDYYIDNTGYKEQNFSATIGTHSGRITSDIYFSHFDNTFGIYSGAEVEDSTDFMNVIHGLVKPVDNGFTYKIDLPKQQSIHDLLKARVFYKLKEHEYLKVVLASQYNQRREYDEHSIDINLPETEYKIRTHSVDLLWEKEGTKQFKHQLGTNLSYQQNHYNGEYFIPEYLNQGAGVFYILEKEWRTFVINGSARIDYRDLRADYWIQNNDFKKYHRNFYNTAFALGGSYQPKENLSVTFNILRNWRPPAPNELYSKGMHHGQASYEEGSPALKEEISHKAELEIFWIAKKKFQFNAVFFVQDINRYITLVPDSLPKITPHGALLSFHYGQTHAFFRGIDFQLLWKPTKQFKIEQQSSMLWANDIGNKTFLPLIPPFRFSIEPGYEYKNLEFKIKGDFVARQNRTNTTTDFMPAPQSYFLLGAEIKGKSKIGKQELNYFVRGTNLTNQSYRDYLDRFRYFIDKPGYNISVGLGFSF
ncbi:MAG: TonB-dependent receptor [Bacteroidetes bacterium]|nr:TonB-dependent receptor [Bacteroidota bacterium]